jgi:hypothetical protein
MIQRCTNPKNKRFIDWGGRGIQVCDRWMNSFEAFLEDMGLKPSKDHSIDRIDNNGNYCPENCKWSTAKEQRSNKRDSKTTKYLTFNGEILPQMTWVRKWNISQHVLKYQLAHGRTMEWIYENKVKIKQGELNGIA